MQNKSMTNMLRGMMAYTVGCHETETQEISLVAMKQKIYIFMHRGKFTDRKILGPLNLDLYCCGCEKKLNYILQCVAADLPVLCK